MSSKPTAPLSLDGRGLEPAPYSDTGVRVNDEYPLSLDGRGLE